MGKDAKLLEQLSAVRGRPRPASVVVGVAVVVLVVVAAAVAGVGPAADRAAGSVPPTAVVPAPSGGGARPRAPLPALPSSDPRDVAVAWLQAYRTARYDEAPHAWAGRVRPLVTASLAAFYSRSQEGGAGAAWAQRVAARCDSAVEMPTAVVPAEAPRTKNVVIVQVVATLRTRCAVGGIGGGNSGTVSAGTEAVAATLKMQRGPDGLWRVAAREF